MGKFEASVENLQKFLTLAENDQDYFDGNYIIGLAFFNLTKYDKSIHHLLISSEFDNQSKGKACFALANSYLAIGDKKNCLLNMNKASFLDNQYAKQWLSRIDADKTEIWS